VARRPRFREPGPGSKKAKGNAEQHLAVRRGGRVSFGAAKDNNNGGNREAATGNRGGIRITSMTA
jgi:hypothetical protein